jgi:hypothetical protein
MKKCICYNIEHCIECRYVNSRDDFGYVLFACEYMNKRTVLHHSVHFDPIPDWCELPNKEN